MRNSPLNYPRAGVIRIVLLYASFAGLWILFSDRLVALIFSDPEQITLISTLKGLAFVAVTSLLLFILLRRFAAGNVSVSESDHLPQTVGIRPNLRRIIVIFLLLSAITMMLGWTTFQALSSSLKQRQNSELMATAELKAKQVEDWLQERRTDIIQQSEGVLFRDAFLRWRSGRDSSAAQLLREPMESTLRSYQMFSGELLDLSGRRLLSAGDTRKEDVYPDAMIRQAIQQKEPLFIDIHHHFDDDPFTVAYIAVIRDPKASDHPLGLLIYHIAADRHLFPLIQAWPKPSSSGETMIIRREGNEVVFLNRLRNTSKSPLSIRFPLSTPDLPAARAILQGPGLYEGRDYRGVPVLTAVRKVAGTPWMLIAKVDKAEVYQDSQRLALFGTALTSVVILACGSLLLMIWRQQRLREALALQESEERYRVMYEFSQDAIMTVEPPDWKFTAGNPATIALFGAKDEAEFIHSAPWDLSPTYQPDGQASDVKSKSMIETAMEKGSNFFEWTHTRFNGENFLATVLLTRVAIAGKTLIQATVRDITESKKAQEALLKAKQEWERTFDSVTDLIAIIDNDHRILRVNRAMAQHLGRTPEDCIGLTCYEHVHGTSVPPEFCPHCRTMSDNCQHSEEVNEERLGGIFTVTTTPLRNDEGEILGSVHIAHDITERKRAEEQKEQYHHRLESILDAAGEGIFGLDEEGRITFVNPAATKLFGYNEEELIGRKSHDVFHGNRQDGAPYPWSDCPNCRTMQDGQTRSGEEIYHRKDGSSFPVEYNCTPISEAGRIAGVVVTFRDMTDRKKLEEQFRHAQKMEAIGQLAGGVAHDFNNILSAIIGYGNLAEMKLPDDSPVRHDLEQILQASERATALTQSLLAFSRKQPLKMEVFGLNTVIRRFEKLLRRLLREDIEMKTSYSETELPIRADRGQVEQVIMNLVTNARDAMPGKGELFIETGLVVMDDEFISSHGYGRTGSFAMISVSDTGSGMDEQTRRRIFEPFFTTKELGRGTGLGLATVYGIVRSHDGFIDVYSEPGNGTTFKIYFPVVGQEESLIEPEIKKSLPLIGGTETILLAEDDPSLRKLAATILGSMGYTVIEAANGNEAVAKFIDNRDAIRLVILDGIMPGMNGKDVYREITALSPEMRGIFMSGYAEDIFTKDGVLLNAKDFLQKPVKPSELLNKVREVLDR